MAFYEPINFSRAYKQAARFAGKSGRVATLPDIVAARLTTKPGDSAWENYFTTMSAEYVGVSRAGWPIAIVAHGIGPLANLNGVLAAYGNEFNDKEHRCRGGRISYEEFRKLENGHYGQVNVIDLAATWRRRQYPFCNHPITAKEIAEEPLWQARLGQRWEEYVARHSKFARAWHAEREHPAYTRPCILTMESAGGCWYDSQELFDRLMMERPYRAVAHLLSIGRLLHQRHEYWELDYDQRENRYSLAADVACHAWSDGTRLLGIQSEGNIVIYPDISDYASLVQTRLDQLWRENPESVYKTSDGFWHILSVGGKRFTDYHKKGSSLDHGEPEFLITEHEKIGMQKEFRTKISGHYALFQYNVREIQRIAPSRANAYTIDTCVIESHDGKPTHHVALVSFYRVKVDTSRRLVRMTEIRRDFELAMSLIK